MAITTTLRSVFTKYGITAYLKTSTNTKLWKEEFNSITGKKYWRNTSTNETVEVEPVPTLQMIKILEKSYTKEEIDNTNIFATDKRFLLDGTIVISTDDKLIVNQVVYQIVPPIKVRTFKGTTIINEVHCRG